MIEHALAQDSALIRLIDQLIVFLVLSAIALLPFNEVETLPYIIGELSPLPSAWALLIAWPFLIVSLLAKHRLTIPDTLVFYLLVGFLAIILLTGLINFNEIGTNAIKGRHGPERYFKQVLVYVFGLATSVALYDFFRSKKLNFFETVQLGVLISLFFIIPYSIFELGRIFNFEICDNILSYINKIIRISPHYKLRIRSVSGEGSWFGMYLAFAWPFIINWFMQGRNKVWLKVFVLSFLTVIFYFSYSRFLYAVILSETALFLVFIALFKGIKKCPPRRLLLFCVTLSISLLCTHSMDTHKYAISPKKNADSGKDVLRSFTSKNQYHLSNIGRLGCWKAGFNVGVNNPVFGIGLGQFCFHMKDNIPEWALESDEIKYWANDIPGTNLAPTHNLYSRLFAETGLVGLALWVLAWLVFVVDLWRKQLLNFSHEINTLLLAGLGCILIGFNTDTFRIMEVWILLACYYSIQSSSNNAIECQPHKPKTSST